MGMVGRCGVWRKVCTPMKKARKEEKESGKGEELFFHFGFFFSPAIKSK